LVRGEEGFSHASAGQKKASSDSLMRFSTQAVQKEWPQGSIRGGFVVVSKVEKQNEQVKGSDILGLGAKCKGDFLKS